MATDQQSYFDARSKRLNAVRDQLAESKVKVSEAPLISSKASAGSDVGEVSDSWRPSTFLESLLPPGNFAMMLVLVVAVMWLTGVLKTFDSCRSSEDNSDRSCSAIVTTGKMCKRVDCMVAPIALIVAAVWWFVLQAPGIFSGSTSWARGSDWRAFIVVFPIVAALAVAFSYTMITATSSGTTRVSEGSLPNDETSSWQVINLLLVLFMLLLTTNKCSDLANGRWSPSWSHYIGLCQN